MAVDLALGIRMTLARRISLALGVAPALARALLGGGRALQVGLGDFQVQPARLRVSARILELGLDVDQAGAFGQTPGRASRRMRRGNETVPAPQVAFGRNQPLAALQV